MTAFARTELVTEIGTLRAELRSVNHRYLDLTIKLPESLKAFEDELRNIIKQRISRGKVELAVHLELNNKNAVLQCNPELLQNVMQLCEQVNQAAQSNIAINALEVLNWPQMIKKPDLPIEQLKESLFGLMDNLLVDFIASRQREGSSIAQMLDDKLTGIEQQLAIIKPHVASLYEVQKAKLLKRLDDIQVVVDSSRLEQELVIWLQKIDVTEEIERTQAHITEAQNLLNSDDPIGRRFDFLLQEFNREANTLASKATTTETTSAAIEIKVLVEQLREQVQNVE